MNHELDNLCASGIQTPGGIGSSKAAEWLLDAASYSADAISLWEKHSIKWALKTTISRTFVHTIVALFDCGLVVSEFLARLERKPKQEWTEDEAHLTSRLGKIFYRVLDIVGPEGIEFAFKPQFENMGLGGEDFHRLLSEDGTQLPQCADLSVLSLLLISKVLCKTYIWPFALVMGDALHARAKHIKALQL
jgi:hypothetical protein